MTIKGKDFIKDNMMDHDDPESSTCSVCETHIQAYKYFKKDIDRVLCPHCNKELYFDDMNEFGVVGETNSCHIPTLKEEVFRHVPIERCDECQKFIALIPTEIMYNANHDIFYTGGKDYSVDLNNIDTREVDDSIDQFVRRIKAGEKGLTADQLKLWVSRDISRIITRELYNKGFKI